MPTANIMGNYKTYLKQGEFKEYLMALESSGLLKELTSSFDCEQDLVLQKKIADIFFKHKGSAKINSEMKKELAKYGIEVEFFSRKNTVYHR
jgi:hypothetical protein